jgi:hypothetical protein
MTKKYGFEDIIEYDQIEINRSEYNKKIVRLIEVLLEIDQGYLKDKTSSDQSIEKKAA